MIRLAKVWYVSVQDVKDAYSIKTSANDIAIQRAINAASDEVESMLHRKFYPEKTTHYFTNDDFTVTRSGELLLYYYDILSVSSLIVNGAVADVDDYFISEEPTDVISFPTNSFNSLGKLDSIIISGVFGYSNRDIVNGELDGSITDSAVSCVVTDSSLISVGTTLKLGSEYVKVTGKTQTNSNQTLQTALTNQANSQLVSVVDGSSFNVGEFILIEAEKMRITDIAGNNLIVTRAVDGTVLAAHVTGKVVYVPRTLKIQRAILGSTAAAHTDGVVVNRFTPPGLIQSLTLAETMNILAQQDSAYARVIGSGDATREVGGRGLSDIRKQAMTAYRRFRSGAV